MKLPTHFSTFCCLVAISSSITGIEVADASECQSWIFKPGNFTHDQYTGARVAQYARKPPVEPLDDPRNVTSRYRRTRTNIRGADGSLDTHYQVVAWGNGRGGIDAEWERFHNAWQSSSLTGSLQGGGYYGSGYPNHGYPGRGFPGNGFPGSNFPAYGGGYPGYGYPPAHGYGHPHRPEPRYRHGHGSPDHERPSDE